MMMVEIAGGFQKFLQYIVMQRNKKKFVEEWELASPLHRVRRNTAAGTNTSYLNNS
jgi:hypothetical protein